MPTLLAALVVGAFTTSDARADWPYSTIVVSGGADDPMGAAIRSWGMTRDAFIFFDEVNLTAPVSNGAEIKHFTCDNATCSASTLQSTDAVGSLNFYQNPVHPSMGVTRLTATGPRTLKLVRRSKIDPDCDGDGLTQADGDDDDIKALDLHSYDWDTTSGLGSSLPVEYNFDCVDHGFSETRFLGATAWTCFTNDLAPTAPNTDENLACNNDDTPGLVQWANHLDLTAGFDSEDHPSFDFYGSTNDLAVAGHLKRPGTDRVRVHFPDAASPPSEPIVYYDATGGDLAEHPDVDSAQGKLHMVWNDNVGGSAAILYAVCDFSSTVDCTLQSHWSATPEVVASGYEDAKFAQIKVDGKNQFVVFQYDSNPTAGVLNIDTRVMVVSRCDGDSWGTPEIVRTPTSSSKDQAIVYGHPAIAFNGQDLVAHVALIEADDYRNGYDVGTIGDSTLYWYRKGYAACP